MNNNQTRTYYPSLDGWRGIAILWIAIGHIVFFYDLDISKGGVRYLYNFTQLAYLTVDIFFVISGFLITEMLLRENLSINLRKFIIRRSLRILPQCLALILFVLVIQEVIPTINIMTKVILPSNDITFKLHKVINDSNFIVKDKTGNTFKINVYAYGNGSTVGLRYPNGMIGLTSFNYDFRKVLLSKRIGDEFIYETGPRPIVNKVSSRNPNESYWQYLLFIPNYFPASRIRMLDHLWFVAIVYHFYLFYSSVLLFIRKQTNNSQQRKLYIFFLLLFLIGIINILKWKYGTKYPIYHQMTHFRIDAIFWGCILKLASEFIQGKKLLDKYYFPLSIIILFAGVIFMSLLTWNASWKPDITPLLLTSSYLAFSALLIGTSQKTFLTRLILENRFISWIGKYSYGIYLWHYPFMYILVLLPLKYTSFNNYYLLTIIYMMVSILFGFCSEKLFNKLRINQ
jgi:peptidoglycan/LPS O-acetylase OafA/YrhL